MTVKLFQILDKMDFISQDIKQKQTQASKKKKKKKLGEFTILPEAERINIVNFKVVHYTYCVLQPLD